MPATGCQNLCGIDRVWHEQPMRTISRRRRIMVKVRYAAWNWRIKDAGVAKEDIGYINAHGTSTYGRCDRDMCDQAVFGEQAYRIPVSSTKSMTGHLLGAAGGIEAAFSVLAIHRGLLPPTINLEHPDPECDLDYVPGRAREASVHVVLSNSFGFGGVNACLLFLKSSQPDAYAFACSTGDVPLSRPILRNRRFGYVFRNPALLDQALTHKSHVNEPRDKHRKHNERLEFLGDAVLDLGDQRTFGRRVP